MVFENKQPIYVDIGISLLYLISNFVVMDTTDFGVPLKNAVIVFTISIPFLVLGLRGIRSVTEMHNIEMPWGGSMNITKAILTFMLLLVSLMLDHIIMSSKIVEDNWILLIATPFMMFLRNKKETEDYNNKLRQV